MATSASSSSSSFSPVSSVPSLALLLLLLLLLLLPSPSLAFLVSTPSPHLSFHRHGPLLSGPDPVCLHLAFYGTFRPSDQASLRAFLSSLSPPTAMAMAMAMAEEEDDDRLHLGGRRSLRPAPFKTASIVRAPSVARWWAITRHYSDAMDLPAASSDVRLCGETADAAYSLGRYLDAADMAALARRAARGISADRNNVAGPRSNPVILIFTAQDVFVEGFCMHSCGGRSHVLLRGNPNVHGDGDGDGDHGRKRKVPYAWVGNPGQQCPGLCAWPFARPLFGPPMEPLTAPNGRDVDGMVITIAKLLVSIATDPFGGSAYYHGDGDGDGDGGDDGGDDGGTKNDGSLEAGRACSGQFGHGSYPGYPGLLFSDPTTGASFNMEGLGGARFLVPWIWNPSTGSCAGQA